MGCCVAVSSRGGVVGAKGATRGRGQERRAHPERCSPGSLPAGVAGTRTTCVDAAHGWQPWGCVGHSAALHFAEIFRKNMSLHHHRCPTEAPLHGARVPAADEGVMLGSPSPRAPPSWAVHGAVGCPRSSAAGFFSSTNHRLEANQEKLLAKFQGNQNSQAPSCAAPCAGDEAPSPTRPVHGAGDAGCSPDPPAPIPHP